MINSKTILQGYQKLYNEFTEVGHTWKLFDI